MALISSKHGIITPATIKDVMELNRLAREEDRREVEDTSGQPLVANLFLALEYAQPCLVAHSRKGELLGMFGVVPTGEGQGAIAFVGTRMIEENRMSFLRGSRDVIAYLERDYDFLFNVVDARNAVHIYWLKWLGFSMIRRVEEYGAAKIPVIEFAKVTKRS